MSDRVRLHGRTRIGEKAAGVLSRTVGSWKFLIGQAVFIGVWMLTGGFGHDPMPWLILNVMLSLQASVTGPVLQLSSNRQEAINQRRDDLEATEVDQQLGLTQEVHQMQKELLELQHIQMQILDLLRGPKDA